MNQSEFPTITSNLLKAREKSRLQGAIGFGFASHRLKLWRETFKPITKRSNRKGLISFIRQSLENCPIMNDEILNFSWVICKWLSWSLQALHEVCQGYWCEGEASNLCERQGSRKSLRHVSHQKQPISTRLSPQDFKHYWTNVSFIVNISADVLARCNAKQRLFNLDNGLKKKLKIQFQSMSFRLLSFRSQFGDVRHRALFRT